MLRVATHLAPGVLPLYAFLTDYLAERLGRRGELTVATSYERCAQDMDDVCFVCSIPYLLAAVDGRFGMQAVAAPVLVGDRYAGRPLYFSDVVVRRDSRARGFADLRGCRWAYNEPFSHSGHITVLHHLVAMGETAGYFGDMIEAGFHTEALRMVLDGEADAAAIDSQVLAVELRAQSRLAGALRVVESIGPSTIQPVVVSTTRLAVEERTAILEALLGVAAEPRAREVLRAAGVERFAAVTDRNYDDIRGMLARVNAAGLLDATWHGRWAAAMRAQTAPGGS